MIDNTEFGEKFDLQDTVLRLLFNLIDMNEDSKREMLRHLDAPAKINRQTALSLIESNKSRCY